MGRVVAGALNKQIAAELGTSEVTVKSSGLRSCRRCEPTLCRISSDGRATGIRADQAVVVASYQGLTSQSASCPVP